MAHSVAKPIDARQVEALVRDVLARLLAEQAPQRQAAEAVSTEDLIIQQAVVSTSTLADRLAGVRKLVVTKKAVITPAARDLLKQHKVTISRGAESARGGKPGLVVAVADTQADPAALIRLVSPLTGSVERLAKTGVATVVAELADAVAKEGRLGLLLSGQPHLACCLANRQRGVRAAVARDRDEVSQAIGSLGLNVLVVDPARRNLFQLGQMVKQFLESGPAECPTEFRKQLG
jgi:hypothetical protein